MKGNSDKIKRSYSFFVNMGITQQDFTISDIMQASGWSESTVQAYITKKWRGFLNKHNKTFRVLISEFPDSEDAYIRSISQVSRYNRDPDKPILTENVECLVEKAKEAAILAIDIYNRPMTSFRSQGFIVMMIIAWTSLLHAIFEKNGTDYFYHDKNGAIVVIDGDKKADDLNACLEKYALSLPVKDNLKFFILLRNKIEHRYSPEFDLDICGECQALLNNFEALITSEFGEYYSLNSTLTIPLQVISITPTWRVKALKRIQSEHYKELKSFVDVYRNSLSTEVLTDLSYCFRVFLIPKTANHQSSSDIAIEFIKYDPSQPEQFDALEKGIALIKEKRLQVANQGKF